MEPAFEKQLIWYPEMGVAHYPVTQQKVDYYDQYLELDHTEIGEKLNSFRVDMVDYFTTNGVIDFGIGSGAFMRKRGLDRTKGYDVDPKAKKWLQTHGLYVDIHSKKQPTIDCVCFFDSLEHLCSPWYILKKITKFVFMSLPIFRDLEHIQSSKHFKPNEHFWYFTNMGLQKYMDHNGFKCLFDSDIETVIGREDIHSYVFSR